MSKKNRSYDGATAQAESALAEQAATNGTPAANKPSKTRDNPPRYWIVRIDPGAAWPVPIALCKSYRAADRKARELSAMLGGMMCEIAILRVKLATPPKNYDPSPIRRGKKAESTTVA